jgi:NAD(P)-dependent dehydrogenase (short-subunit alcohol dehydrogenase family)
MKKTIPIDQKIAVITGGASGLGLAIAKKFAAQNLLTIIIGRNPQKLKKAKALLGARCETIPFDVTKLDEIPALSKKIKTTYGRVDILVNNAGINLKKDMLHVTDQEFQQILLTNVTSVFVISREVSKIMTSRKKGSIINISSMAAQYGIPKVIAYAASKSAIEGMTRSMAVELSPLGIMVNCIAPGFIKTKMSSTALNNDPERKRRVIERTPLGKLGLPEDVANMAYYLVSNDNSFVTGAILPVDGGNSIGF